MKDFFLVWGPALVWAAILFLLSELREVPPALESFTVLNNKLIHFLLYSTLGAALAWGRHRGGERVAHAVLLVAGYTYGALDEWHQSFVPGRNPSVADWVANVAGVTAGYFVFLGALRVLRGRPGGGPGSGGDPLSPAGRTGHGVNPGGRGDR